MKIIIVAAVLSAFVKSSLAGSSNIESCWAEWKNGNVEQASICTEKVNSADRESQLHLLMNIYFAKGQYIRVTREFKKVSPNYKDYKSIISLTIQAHLHLHQYRKAKDLADSSKVIEQETRIALQEMADFPATYSLNDVDVIPFKNDQLNPYMPSFDMAINGKPLVGQIDTGGNHVAMSPKLADELGIKYVFIGDGNANNQQTKIWLGHADFRIGNVLVKNASIYVLESLNGTFVEKRPIFGTTVLSHFLVTLDYPNQQLILSPKGNSRARKKHLNLLPKTETEMPFYLWADHYMFAKGSIGHHKQLNFFVDTGLVALDGTGKQAGFYGNTDTFLSWGYPEADLKDSFVDLQGLLGLGKLEQEGQMAFHTKHFPVPSLGGVTIHGMIAHAFLKKYVWTLDFEKRTYLFAQYKQPQF